MPCVCEDLVSEFVAVPIRCSEEDPVSGGSAARTGGRELFSGGHAHAL